MKVGFTGTRNGMTEAQKCSFTALIAELNITELHHGDCVGADDDAANLAREVDYREPCRIHCHPPVDEKLRAWNRYAWETYPAKTHFARNRDIVDMTDALIAIPWVRPLPSSGGTVYTINYARKIGRRVMIIWPDGTVEI